MNLLFFELVVVVTGVLDVPFVVRLMVEFLPPVVVVVFFFCVVVDPGFFVAVLFSEYNKKQVSFMGEI